LADHVEVDVQRLSDRTRRLILGTPLPDDLSPTDFPADAIALLSMWQDDWAIIERERMRQRVLHAMEALSRNLSETGRHDEAVQVARTVVAAEPLRESAHRVLIGTCLARGDRAGADRAFAAFQALIRSELGAEPSDELTRLMAGIRQA